MGAMQRRKGAAFERTIARRLLGLYPGAKRGLGQARAAGEVPDVDVPGLWIECKHGKRTSPKAALAQAIEAAGDSGRVPLAICRDNGAETTVTMRLEDFLAWLEDR